jgi:hypothetical protein
MLYLLKKDVNRPGRIIKRLPANDDIADFYGFTNTIPVI